MLDNIITLIIISSLMWLVMLIYLSNHQPEPHFTAPTSAHYFNGSQTGKVKVPNKLSKRNELLIDFAVKTFRSVGTLTSIKMKNDYYMLQVTQQGALSLVIEQPSGVVSTLITFDNLRPTNTYTNISLRFQYPLDSVDEDDFNITLCVNGSCKDVLVTSTFKVPKVIYLCGTDKPGFTQGFQGVLKNVFVNEVPIVGPRMKIHS